MTDSVYQRVLGPDIALIREDLRDYFTAGDHAGIGDGTMQVAGSRYRWLRPILAFLARQRILFPEYGTDVRFQITNTPTPNGALHAVRTFYFPGRERPLEDTMRVVDGRLHDFMGKKRGLEIEMQLTVVNGEPIMQSGNQWLHVGKARIRLPQIATVRVAESITDSRRSIDVRLRSPIIGEWFRYTGTFSYTNQNSNNNAL